MTHQPYHPSSSTLAAADTSQATTVKPPSSRVLHDHRTASRREFLPPCSSPSRRCHPSSVHLQTCTQENQKHNTASVSPSPPRFHISTIFIFSNLGTQSHLHLGSSLAIFTNHATTTINLHHLQRRTCTQKNHRDPIFLRSCRCPTYMAAITRHRTFPLCNRTSTCKSKNKTESKTQEQGKRRNPIRGAARRRKGGKPFPQSETLIGEGRGKPCGELPLGASSSGQSWSTEGLSCNFRNSEGAKVQIDEISGHLCNFKNSEKLKDKIQLLN
ncbi:hypothetical protein LR48_Vigan06g151400 [Vigna angularis]|uniref:Uncharacterized protein n=1 Tax=Phaseolus angularis TaxID=3914 RepID=A0A0L9UTY0_PHAAN|nr:hypothetical protein LR48_Vigan06g151400 [Vigna angularis]